MPTASWRALPGARRRRRHTAVTDPGCGAAAAPLRPGGWQLRRAVDALRQGGIVAYPTEAVFGLGCYPQDAEAVRRLLALKRRPGGKGLILIAADMEQIEPYLQPLPPSVAERIRSTWPGPVTWLWPARRDVPRWLTGAHDTLAVRVTAHPVAAALCRHAGSALVSTSANRSGRPPARSALAVRRVFGAEVDYVLPGSVGSRARPTAIRDAMNGVVIRAG